MQGPWVKAGGLLQRQGVYERAQDPRVGAGKINIYEHLPGSRG